MAGIQILLMLIALSVASCELIAVQGDGKSLPIVRIDGREGVRERRQASRMPIRIMPFYDSTVAELDASKRDMIQTEIIPNLISFLSNTLSVTPSTNAILLNNQCNDNSGTFFILQDGTGRIACPNQCATVTKCGVYSVQVEHLKQCLQCNGVNSVGSCTPAVGVPSADGAGVANTDFVLYISANQSACPPLPASGPTTVAFATHCQLEDSIDRPVAGNVNFCPEGIARNVNGLQYIAAVTKHELLHALGFSSSLFPFWHDQNGNPRTSRTENQFPTMAGTSTIERFTYPMWQTRGGKVTHTVRSLVTPTVVSAGREHFGCPTLGGVELENQGGSGTAMDHWEKRILGNEAMTGVFTSNPVFSNITLAALYDTGWYDVNFTMAEGLLWGRGQGCNFVRRSCLETIETQRQSGVNAIFPFCNEAGRLGCTVDRLSVAQCNLVSTSDPPPPSSYISEYQYFSDSLSRGGVEVTDFCPFYQSVQFSDGRFPVCSQQSSAPSVNTLLESYGMSSRCLTHGRDWVVGGIGVSSDGGGCYQYSCSPTTGVTITVNGEDYTCTCTGEEVIIDMMVDGVAHFGSVICPACQDICHDSLSQCPTSAASVCYGRSVSLNGSVLVDVTNPPTRPSKGVTLAPFLTSLWMVLVSAVQTFYL